ncbi:hypothetical protein PanWU01x14_185290 [Parasponia andersonii]|uniref:Uncharacterized protein n=1 Tax=Parasponia andersonii TaxID=3476 RepID=A0A2P5C4B1_PARAD|nr:hypothetical protein PanWU01x14_185290 [Parasponia andersonii]
MVHICGRTGMALMVLQLAWAGLFILVWGGLDKKSGITLFFPLICLTSKEYWENHVASRSSWALTDLFCLKVIIPWKDAKSVLTRKWCPIKWNSNFIIPIFTASSSLNVEW